MCCVQLHFPLSASGRNRRSVICSLLGLLVSTLMGVSGGVQPVEPHWAFQPLATAEQIGVSAARSSGSPIDILVQARLKRHGLKANGPADKHTLIRRVSFDLTGLPPTPEEIDNFVSDPSPAAFPKLIDRLLASPAYGERWGRYWLDLARYADSNGADENMAHPNAWRYRDYVIRSFNQDKPYDRFLREQLAGDLLPASGDAAADIDQLIATGFLALGPKMLAEQDKDKMLIDVVDEQIDVVSQTFMGLTISCARCHDHKFDPVSQQDYFALAGVFSSTKTMANTNHVSRWVETVLELPGNDEIIAEHERQLTARKAELAAVEAEEKSEERDKRLKELKEQLKKLESDGAPLPKAMTVKEGQPVDLAVHVRGNHLSPVDTPTARGVNGLFSECLSSPTVGSSNSGRLELAEWLTDPRHPLTARVMVNRIWQGHFGSGLVRSPSNFGLRGEPPTHPQLLDWLAREFISTGWSVKHMHRTIMLSAAYQRSSQADPAQTVADPDNIYLARQNRRRLEAEPIRDALLFVSGRLDQSGDRSLGKLETNKEYYRAEQESFEKLTRAVYLPVVRANGYEMFATFDAADPAVHHQQRATTIVPSQALFMLNGELAFNAARDLAAGITENPAGETEARLNDLYLRLFGRPVRPQEAALLLGEFPADNEEGANPTIADWERICRVLIAANEFVYVN
jgi:hypothetical protein